MGLKMPSGSSQTMQENVITNLLKLNDQKKKKHSNTKHFQKSLSEIWTFWVGFST